MSTVKTAKSSTTAASQDLKKKPMSPISHDEEGDVEMEDSQSDGDEYLDEDDLEDISDDDADEDNADDDDVDDDDDGAEEEFQFADEEDWLADQEAATPVSKKKDFKVLDAEALINSQQEQVIHVSEVLGIPVSVGGHVLRTYAFNKEKLFQDFIEDQAKVLKKCGINMDDFQFHTAPGGSQKQMCCNVCYEDRDAKDMLALGCMHLLCRWCWKDFLEVAISDGPSCLQTRCPHPKCNRIVHETLFKELVSPEKYRLYSKYVARSFVDDNPRIRWCPAPDCGKAVYCPEGNPSNAVECSCGNKFCFKCQREHHEPCSCDELTAWIKKEKDESETATWLVANTRDCPKCKRSIEKNGGCNHMTCSMCKHEFCWVCNEDWTTHGANTGGYYKCNKYKPEELAEKTGEKSRESARAALEKYMHYYRRYANHDRSQRFEKQLREKAEEKMKELQQVNKYSSWVDVEFVNKGVEQLIECRRSLKYTYVFGYYLKDGPEKDLFEYLQEDLERTTEKLSEILEGPVEKFNRDEIIATTRSAEKRLQHLLEGCRAGLTRGEAAL